MSSASSIFRNRAILSAKYIPETLIHREDKLKLLNSLFSGASSSPSKCFLQTVQLVGPSGSGKTSIMQVFGRSLEQEGERFGSNIKHVYLNLKEHGDSKSTLFRHLLAEVAPDVNSFGMSAQEVLTQTILYLRQKKMYLVLSLDEVDSWLKGSKNSSVVYDLTRLNENITDGICNVLGIMFAARSTSFYDKLDDADKSTLGRIPIFFQPYSSKEIEDILLLMPGDQPDRSHRNTNNEN